MTSIQEYLGVPAEWPVKESVKHELVLFPNKRDIQRGRKGDPRACALHNAACRMFDIPNCAIGGRFAFIPQRDARGKWYIAKMEAPVETQRATKKFDKTGEMPEGGFRFIPVSASQRMAVKRAYMKKWHAGEVGNAGGKRKFKRGAQRLKAPVRGIPRGLSA